LKPENILMVSPDSDVDVKIGDFGFAKYAETETSLLTQCGTPTYVAPEIIRGVPYGTKVDMWSLGVIMFVLLGGYPPFYDQDKLKMLKLVKNGTFDFDETYWSGVSMHARDSISMLLNVDPYERITAGEALDSTWMQNS